ncbi:MAG: hypothetical protein PHG00_14385 [Methylococcales bacterium]|nr:hypothetical protein [Methylococcales bacterium]
MNTRLVSVLAIVCAVLVLIIFGEWFYARQTQKRLLAPITSTEIKISLEEMPVIKLSERSAESYSDMVDRPLFIKGRKPVDEPPSAEEAQGLAAAENIFDWRLDGVYSSKKGLFALFSRPKLEVPKDNFRKLTMNNTLNGWKVAEIHKDKVLLKQGTQQKELLLQKPKIKQTPMRSHMPNIPKMPDMPHNIAQPPEQEN